MCVILFPLLASLIISCFYLPFFLNTYIWSVEEKYSHTERNLKSGGCTRGVLNLPPPHWMSENYSSKEVYISKNKVSWNIHTKRNQKKNQRGYFWGFEIVRKSVRFCLFPFLFLLHIDHMPRVILISLYKVFNLSL